MSTAGSISESQLGLTASEVMILRQTTEVAAQSRTGGSTTMDRGRGTSRQSQPSSRAASAASSHSIQGRITMDSNSLGRIENALLTLMRQIAARIEQLEDAAEQTTESTARGAADSIKGADDQIARTRKIMAKLDELETKMEEVRNVCRKIHELREKCDKAGGRLDQIQLQRAGARPPTSSRH